MRITTYDLELKDKINILVKDRSFLYDLDHLNSPPLVVKLMNDAFKLGIKAEEFCYLIAVNNKNHVIGIFMLSKGSVNTSICTPREMFIRLLLCGATNFFLVHNHPSGDPDPSDEDKNLTNRIIECGKLMNIRLMDHIVIGNSLYFSFKEHGLV